MGKVTAKQKLVIDAIVELKDKNKRWPSLREIAAHINYSRGGVGGIVTKLHEQGIIQKFNDGAIRGVITDVEIVASTHGKARKKKPEEIQEINHWLTVALV